MMRSMFSSVSAIRAHQTRMDVIGDNIANVNTIGFKSSRATFASVFASVLRSATAPNSDTGMGGSNPMQIGLGVQLSSIDLNMSRGSLQRTDNTTDMSIEGNGFFIVGGDGKAPRFTRAGNFTLDKSGNLVTQSGLNVLGWKYDLTTNSIDTSKTPEKINILSLPNLAPKATDRVVFEGNLNASTDIYNATQVTNYDELKNVDSSKKYATSVKVYDSQGEEHTLQLSFVKIDNNKWRWALDGLRDINGNYIDTKLQQSTNQFIAYGELQFGNDGKVTSVAISGGANASGNAITIKFQPNTVNDITFDIADPNKIFNLKAITQYSMDSSIRISDITGYEAGSLQGFSVDSRGIITGIYSNGRNQLLGQIAIADFSNPSGLQRVGDNLFINTVNSGEPEIGVAGTASRGTISQGTIEMSNVDLAKEFTDMIITQRGYQANARVITSSDEILQDLVNLKR